MTVNQSRVDKGVPAGGQFQAEQKAADALAELEDKPFPGSRQIVACQRCAADPVRRDDPGCKYCDNGNVTTDRYGQVPWHPEAPGTAVAFEKNGEWHSATMTAMASDGNSDAFATGILADGVTSANVYLPKAIPLQAAQSAAKYGINTHEMIDEAAVEMNLGVDPTLDEVRAFMARIDEGYLDDIAMSARQYRSSRAEELRAMGRTGPALDTNVTLPPEVQAQVDLAIDRVSDFKGQSYASMTYVVARENWHGHTIVVTPDGRVSTYKDTAWTKPEQDPMLPWEPPTGIPVAHVALDGTVTRADTESKR